MEKIPILFEDDEIYVINKRAGLASQGGEGVAHSVDEELSRQVASKVYLVHRLDKETCGLMIVAKNSKAASKWIDLISSKSVQKEYTAICFGEPVLNAKKQKSGTISGTVVKKNGKNEREMSAVTNFSVEKTFTVEISAFSDNPEQKESKLIPLTFSKIHLKLGTGRMHQIRIHLAKVDSPICGDDKHGNFKLNKLAKKHLKIKNLLLCSSRLTIPLKNGKTKIFEIELPEYFNAGFAVPVNVMSEQLL